MNHHQENKCVRTNTKAYFAFMGMPAQPDQDQFRFRRAALYSSLKRKRSYISYLGYLNETYSTNTLIIHQDTS